MFWSNFVVSLLGGDSVADFWGLDAHEARLRCPDDVNGDMQEDAIPGGALSLNLRNYPDHGHQGNFSPARKNPRGRTGNRTRDFMISSQRLWPLDHEAGHKRNIYIPILFIGTEDI